jgi:hypothetical protein
MPAHTIALKEVVRKMKNNKYYETKWCMTMTVNDNINARTIAMAMSILSDKIVRWKTKSEMI